MTLFCHGSYALHAVEAGGIYKKELLCFLSFEDDRVERETNSLSDFPISSIPS